MSEFRQNIATGEWVIICQERGQRPSQFGCSADPVLNGSTDHEKKCPFCVGGEAEKVDALYQKNDENGWKIRVIPNKYAALNTDTNPKRRYEGMFLKAGGYGVAEVLIETPEHDTTIATMNIETIEEILRAYKIRYNELSKDKNLNLINIFRNYGASAGASLEHPHSQIIGSLVSPPHVSDQIYHAQKSYNTWGKCVYCEMIEEELKQEVRIVYESRFFVALCPYASRSPYETRILPKFHSSAFGNISEEQINDFASMLKIVLKKIYVHLDNPDYNYLIRSVNSHDSEVLYYHWYMVIVPKIKKSAGFEMACGIFINTSQPEECAKALREL